jgi:Zn-dependent peptidase ImmA (M78 family)
MQLSRDSIASLLSCVACVQQYRQRNKDYPIGKPIAIKKTSTHVQGWAAGSTELTTLHTIVESLIQKPVDIVEFDKATAPAVDGMCIELKDKALIFVNKDLNYCWRRFVAAKELAHLVMNHVNDGLRATSKESVSNTISELIKRQVSPSSSAATIAEVDAYAGAVEMLYPRDSVDLFQRPGMHNKLIAEEVKIPSNIIAIRNDDKDTISMHQQVYDDSRYDNAIIFERIKRAQ